MIDLNPAKRIKLQKPKEEIKEEAAEETDEETDEETESDYSTSESESDWTLFTANKLVEIYFIDKKF